MADRLYRWSLKIVPRIFVWISRVWFSSCRLQVQESHHIDDVSSRGAGIAVFWHYSFAYLFHHLRRFPAAVMVSASRDGEYIAEVAKLMGHTPLRGSSNRGGVKALRAMVNEVKHGRNAGIVADGSKGPARRVQPGCILVAAKSGRPIIPMVWAADRYLAFNSWDRTVLPMPFSRIVLRYGEPLTVDAKVTSEEVEQYRLELELRMNELYDTVWRAVDRPPHDC